MNREMLMLVDAISREKSVDLEVVFAAVGRPTALLGVGSALGLLARPRDGLPGTCQLIRIAP